MKRWKIILPCALAALIAVIAYAHTDDTDVGRLPLTHPDQGHEGGAALHTKVRTAWTKIADEMDSRWKEITVGAAATEAVVHNFNVTIDNLRIILYDGQGAAATRITKFTTPSTGDFTIAATGGDVRNSIDITNNTGGSEDLSVLIVQGGNNFDYLEAQEYVRILDEGDIRFREDPTNGSNHVGFKAPANVPADKTWTLPATDGAANQALVTDGSGVLDWKTATGGAGINYIENFDYEDGTSAGWSHYDDASTLQPVDGTGEAGSTDLSASIDTGSILIAANSFKLANSASAQGEGYSYDFKIDAAYVDSPKLFKIEFNYLGDPNFDYGDFSNPATTPSDIVVYIYNIDSSQLIQPSNFVLDGSGIYSGTFQPQAGDDDYRLILHVAKTTVFTQLWADNVIVGPQSKVTGPAMSDMDDFDASGLWSNVTIGSGGSFFGHQRRVGDHLEVYTGFTLGTGGDVTGDLIFTLPDGKKIDVNKTTSNPLGGARGYDSTATTKYNAPVIRAAATALKIDEDGGAGFWDAAAPFNWDASDVMGMWISVPIAGWSSRTQLSDEGETRVVAASASGITEQIFGTSESHIKFNTTNFDTHNGFTHNPFALGGIGSGDGTKYIVPVSGKYSIGFLAHCDRNTSAWNVGTGVVTSLRVNQISVAKETYVAWVAIDERIYAKIDRELDLMAGDEIQISLDSAVANARAITDTVVSKFDIARLSGPSAIAASEVVAAKYTSNTADTMTDGDFEVLFFDDKEFDTHGAVSFTTFAAQDWIFTAPISGYYQVNVSAGIATVAWTVDDFIELSLQKNSSTAAILDFILPPDTTISNVPAGSAMVQLDTGETLRARLRINRGADTNLGTAGYSTQITIHRIGGVMFLIFPVWLLIGRRKKHVLDDFKLAA